MTQYVFLFTASLTLPNPWICWRPTTWIGMKRWLLHVVFFSRFGCWIPTSASDHRITMNRIYVGNSDVFRIFKFMDVDEIGCWTCVWQRHVSSQDVGSAFFRIGCYWHWIRNLALNWHIYTCILSQFLLSTRKYHCLLKHAETPLPFRATLQDGELSRRWNISGIRVPDDRILTYWLLCLPWMLFIQMLQMSYTMVRLWEQMLKMSTSLMCLPQYFCDISFHVISDLVNSKPYEAPMEFYKISSRLCSSNVNNYNLPVDFEASLLLTSGDSCMYPLPKYPYGKPL